MSTIPSTIGSSSQVPHVSDTPSPEGKAVGQDGQTREAAVSQESYARSQYEGPESAKERQSE